MHGTNKEKKHGESHNQHFLVTTCNVVTKKCINPNLGRTKHGVQLGLFKEGQNSTAIKKIIKKYKWVWLYQELYHFSPMSLCSQLLEIKWRSLTQP